MRARSRPTVGVLPLIRAICVALLAVGILGWTIAVEPHAFAAGSTTSTVPAPKKAVVTFGTQTASATAPDQRRFFDFGATPGGNVFDHVAVINYSSQPITVSIRGTDGENDDTGKFTFRPVNQVSTDIGLWIKVLRSDLQVTIPARSNVIVPFLVSVPSGASPGDHIGGITATLESSIVSKNGPKVHLLQTVGSEVYVRVSGPLHPRLSIEDLKVHFAGTLNPIGTGSARLSFRVANTGNIALAGRQTVYVTGLFGSKTSTLHVKDLPLLLPGFSAPVTVSMSGVPPEIYEHARVSVRPLAIAGSATPQSGPYAGAKVFWAIPWTAIALVVVILMIIVVLILRRRRRRKKAVLVAGSTAPDNNPEEANDIPHIEAQPEEDAPVLS